MIVWQHFAFYQGLRAVFECVRQRVAPDVAYREVPALLGENKIDASGCVRDGTGAHVSGDAHALVQGRALKRRELCDRVVVRLALREADVGQGQQRYDNNSRAYEEFMPSMHVNAPWCS